MRTVYILRCSDETLYTGITTDISRRVAEHNDSPLGAKYTKNRRPVYLVRSQEVDDRSSATKLEMQIKKLSRRRKQELLEAGDHLLG